MNSFIQGFKAQIDLCRSAETELGKMQLQLETSRNKFSQAEVEATSGNVDEKAISGIVAKLETQRRGIAELEYRIKIQSKTIDRLHVTLRKTTEELAGKSGEIFDRLRSDVMAELRRRVAPFQLARIARAALRESRVRALAQASRHFNGIAGHLPSIAEEPVESAATILSKYESLLKADAAVRAELGVS